MDIDRDLNPAQREAVITTEGPLLVIAGAGSGKTRTLVHRLARLVNMGVDPGAILLLTFTRKAAMEMLARAGTLLGVGPQGFSGVAGGTFHSFAFSALRRYHQAAGLPAGFTVLDRPDIEDVVGQVRDALKLGKGDRSFPKRGNIAELVSKSRNTERDIADLLARESPHLLGHAEALNRISGEFATFKAAHHLLDYDDLLFHLEKALTDNADLRRLFQTRHRYIMVDEYQDTNPVQARLIALLAPESGNVMAVGDDAQSIYAFRGANVRNILDFPKTFPGTKIVTLEQNYRSTQPILGLTNAILARAGEKFEKNLFSTRAEGAPPELLRPFSDLTQARMVAAKVRELAQIHALHDIAVLFRAGYQSYALEIELAKAGIPFQKYGGIKFAEAAHVKDVVAYLRVVHNTADPLAVGRVLSFIPGIGPKTAATLHKAIQTGDAQTLAKAVKKSQELAGLLEFLDLLRSLPAVPATLLERVADRHAPYLKDKYPDDYPRRLQGLEQLLLIAANYATLDAFLADMAIDPPNESRGAAKEDHLVLSTVHSAKGLEWNAVLLIDMVDERFPSRHALSRPQDLEEERRLLYVACTRAKDHLSLFVPETVYQRGSGGCDPALPSLFLRELPTSLFASSRERLAPDGETCPAPSPGREAPAPSPRPPAMPPEKLGYCRHKIFGRGKIIASLGDDKYRINFPGFGPKVILGDYLVMEGAE